MHGEGVHHFGFFLGELWLCVCVDLWTFRCAFCRFFNPYILSAERWKLTAKPCGQTLLWVAPQRSLQWQLCTPHWHLSLPPLSMWLSPRLGPVWLCLPENRCAHHYPQQVCLPLLRVLSVIGSIPLLQRAPVPKKGGQAMKWTWRPKRFQEGQRLRSLPPGWELLPQRRCIKYSFVFPYVPPPGRRIQERWLVWIWEVKRALEAWLWLRRIVRWSDSRPLHTVSSGLLHSLQPTGCSPC